MRNAFMLVSLVFSAPACSEDAPAEQSCATAEEGLPTGSTCPPGSTLTYENFAKPFAETYCTHCHSSERSGADRNCAPLGHDFDSEDGILAVLDHVDEYAAAGPNAVNESMPPPGNPQPTEEERRKLGEWLACEAADLVDGGDGGH